MYCFNLNKLGSGKYLKWRAREAGRREIAHDKLITSHFQWPVDKLWWPHICFSGRDIKGLAFYLIFPEEGFDGWTSEDDSVWKCDHGLKAATVIKLCNVARFLIYKERDKCGWFWGSCCLLLTRVLIEFPLITESQPLTIKSSNKLSLNKGRRTSSWDTCPPWATSFAFYTPSLSNTYYVTLAAIMQSIKWILECFIWFNSVGG